MLFTIADFDEQLLSLAPEAVVAQKQPLVRGRFRPIKPRIDGVKTQSFLQTVLANCFKYEA